MRLIIPALALFLTLGCTNSDPAPTATATGARTIQMDDATLYIDGDKWLYSFPVDGRQCVIVATDVAFIERWTDHLVINLDLTETEKSRSKADGSQTLLNVPTNEQHEVLVVHPGGILEVSIPVPQQLEPGAFLQKVLAHPGVAGEIRNR